MKQQNMKQQNNKHLFSDIEAQVFEALSQSVSEYEEA